MTTGALSDLRTDYARGALDLESLSGDPMTDVARWLADAVAAGVPEPNAMVVATVDDTGAPDARVVLVKGVDPRGIVFFTNYTSRKGAQLAARPQASAVFFWQPLERQVRIAGDVTQVSSEESDAYFASRPRASQLGAWASHQSQPVADRATLERRLAETEARFAGGAVPRPPHWGGYRIAPRRVELWQGRVGRLHDRFVYERADGGGFVPTRLEP
jgi:pyridoxamine 5'-phosphate oxidase